MSCGCCNGVEAVTPIAIVNRPGLARLNARVGTHATFLESMLARLSSPDYPELSALTTREPDDFGIALLDAWAVVADVLTFYEERLVNEGYLRSATERRSLLELARLVGYTLRPGLSASVYLAYTLEKDSPPVEIPAGTKASSVPGPGEELQTFETSEPLEARADWNELAARRTVPQTQSSIENQGLYLTGTALNLRPNDPLLVDFGDGKLKLVSIDTVELDHESDRTRAVLRVPTGGTLSPTAVKALTAKFAATEKFGVSRTSATAKRVLAVLDDLNAATERPAELAGHVQGVALPRLEDELRIAQDSHFTKLAPWIDSAITALRSGAPGFATSKPPAVAAPTPALQGVPAIIDILEKQPSVQPARAQDLVRDVSATFAKQADTLPRLLTSLRPELKSAFYATLKDGPPVSGGQIRVYALRVAAAPFGHNAGLRLTNVTSNFPVFGEWTIDNPWNQDTPEVEPGPSLAADTPATPDAHTATRIFLDNDYDVKPETFVAVTRGGSSVVIEQASAVIRRSFVGYGLSGKSVQIDLPEGASWLDDSNDFAQIRGARVFTGSELLPLAECPLPDAVEGGTIELADVYEDLEPGRWLVVAGERTDVPASGVLAAEVVMLAGVEQRTRLDAENEPVTGDQVHTFVSLAQGLAYSYARSSVKIYGNVVKATHGETRNEVLGSGDATVPLQTFPLKQPPLTYVSAPTPSGVASTLEVRVNDVEWHEAETLADLDPNTRGFVTRTDDAAKTSVVFGSGVHGARLPTGVENVTARYRKGIGKGGNVQAGQISLATDRPLGVKEVTNPLRSSGGADADGSEDARQNAPLPLLCLDRLVSLSDYAAFARTFAGVGKATATRLSDGHYELVEVTIAGAEDIPIDESSDLFRNLASALRAYGDPHVRVRLAVRQRLGLVIAAKVRVAADYAWEFVEPAVRAALLATFGFERAELGTDLFLSDAIAAAQNVTGVEYVDFQLFDTISEAELVAGFDPSATSALALGVQERVTVSPAKRTGSTLTPAELAYLAPDVPDTLLLQELLP